ncbi:hypothetical protein HHL17_19810 [Chitinophaga sp. G-6-1-13]|uniref:Uncharacterized protein n=1 Tax=Chitinophaga fulva TaxID=2728842 RepID=A0A848GNF2_9BACT|nr:hypothetical protein [Chitinophaga fulva]NML39457.1 hypothetical protein [Chitinophaga fulva]
MSGKLMVTCLCALSVLYASAQNSPQIIAQSQSFEEPENGASRLLLMQNGHTLFFHFTPGRGIDVTVYGPDHRERVVTHANIESWKNQRMRFSELRGIYEINGQAVVFLENQIQWKPRLYRFIFDSNNGSLLSEKLIASLPGPALLSRTPEVHDNQHSPVFMVRKDPSSDYYAVAMSDLGTRNPGQQLRVCHYSPQHELLSDAPFDLADRPFKYIDIADMYVQGDTSVFVAAFAYNAGVFQNRDSRLVIGTLPRGRQSFQTALLEHTARLQIRDVAMKYHPQSGMLYLLTSAEEKLLKKSGEEFIMRKRFYERYALLMNIIDPRNLSVKQHYFVVHPLLNKYAKEHLQYRYAYEGVAQDFHINADGTTQILFEELNVEAAQHTSFNHNDSTGGFHTTASGNYISRLGEIGISRLDTAGRETESYAIAKDQMAQANVDIFHINHRNQSGWTFRDNGDWLNLSGFGSYDFFHAGGKDYILYNDATANIEDKREDYRSKERISWFSRTNTVCAVYDNGQITKTYLYGAPQAGTSRFSQLEMITRSKDGKSFATMMIERTGKKKEARVVWVTL